ncbi:hypothetical protein [Nostoc sp. 'Lobaria pulmonaria (5183) cyanobiont']|uniref:hypothetical protein n=1 Tax=Nostoc sp. 'Lobaria pulmonaria (5183) cyanobiont' TaxID=1618022 RepID=UPI00131A08D2|nr:hypothetical protein [Nostoc sp. 'Lobaria pulmonaria (5183) cyanobiont']
MGRVDGRYYPPPHVPERPGRSEARVKKRRPKAYSLMIKPWHELRKQLQTA